jgi:predicted NUDIX family phosphoesterase
MQKQLFQQTIAAACDEQILVIKRDIVFQSDGAWHGLKQCDYDWYLWAIEHYGQFQSRIAMENDPRYKQIIPYLVFMHQDKVFVVERKKTASEQRLAGKLSIGIGGHIRKDDLLGSTIFDWARREFNEEVNYHDHFEFEPLGIVNDERDSVGQVHLGFVFLIRGSTPNISIKSELKQGQLVPYSSLTDTSRFESWSQIVLPYLQ